MCLISTVSASSVTALDHRHVSLPDSIRLKKEEEAGCKPRRIQKQTVVLTSSPKFRFVQKAKGSE